MSRGAALLGAAVLAGLACPGPQGPGAELGSAVDREWAIRRWALDPHAHEADLLDALATDDWSVRTAALEALRRAALSAPDAGRGGPDEPWAVARRAVADAHPNVRAAALAALAESAHPALAGGLAAGELARLAEDPLPEVRVECARLSARRASGETLDLLSRLAGDERAAVAAAARAELFALEPPAELVALVARTRIDAVLRFERAEGAAGFLAVLDHLAEGRTSALLLDGLRAARPAGGEDSAARAALVEAIALHRLGVGDSGTLARGWLAPLRAGATVEAWEDLPRRRRALQLAAAARAGPPLGAALLEAAAREPSLARAQALLEGAVEALPVRELCRRALVADLAPELAEALWDRLYGRAEGWDETATGPWLSPERDPAVRAAVVGVLGETLRRTGDPGSASLLVGALTDPVAANSADAFRALADAPDPAPGLVALHDAWQRLPVDERLARLDLLPRAAPADPFREDLLLLGARPGTRTASVIELAGRFAGDAEVAAALRGWLEEDVAVLERPGSSTERLVELRVRSLARAAGHAMGAESAPVLAALLRRVAPIAREAAKGLAAALGSTDAGRAELLGFLGPAYPTRVRVEAALWTADADHPEATVALRALYAGCDAELRGRILRRLRRAPDADTLAFLRAVAGARGTPIELRMLALDTLVAIAAAGHAQAVHELLAELVGGGGDVEAYLAVVGALGALAEETPPVALAVRATLVAELRARAPDWSAPAAELEEALRAWAPVRDELLPALARAGATGPLHDELLTFPSHAARADLEARFRGRRTPATEFTYRAELATAEILSAQGRLGAALEGSGADLSRLDARLLFQLAERAFGAGGPEPEAAVERLYRAALVAVPGEPPHDDLPGISVISRTRLSLVARRRGEWAAARHWIEGLLADWYARSVPPRSWARAFGSPDPAAGIDPRARLESALPRLSAWEALATGRIEDAERWAAVAGRRLGLSAAAGREQARLQAAIEAER